MFSLIFPTYNPGAVIERTWRETAGFLDGQPDWEVLFACDGCTDGTPERLRELIGAYQNRVQVLAYTPNQGKGFAVRCGLQAARGDYIIFTDVDLAYSLENVMRIADALRAGSDVAIASRQHPESQVVVAPDVTGYAWRRRLQSMVFSSLVRGLLPLTQRDTQAGLKGLTARASHLIAPHLKCNGFGFDCELLTACVRFGLPIVEIPVTVRVENHDSTTTMWTTGEMFRELLKIRKAWHAAPPAIKTNAVCPASPVLEPV